MQNSRILRMFSIDNEVLCCSSWSCSNSCLMMAMAFVVGTDVTSVPTTKAICANNKSHHTDLYPQWDSHHTLTSKYSMIGTLQHRAQTICSNPHLLQKEEQHLKNALKKCKYITWALNRIQMKTKKQDSNQVPTTRTNMKKSYIVVPYYSGLSESIKNIGSKFGVQVYFKEGTTIKNLLMSPKDKDPIQKQSGVIYRYHCDRVDCDEEYIGESSGTLGERFKEHLKAPSPIYDHSNITGHNATINKFNIVGREDLNQMRTIKRLCT